MLLWNLLTGAGNGGVDKLTQVGNMGAGERVSIESIEKSVELLKGSSIDYEFRTTVTRELHTPKDFEKIGEWIKGAKRYYIQNFVDSHELISNTSSPLDSQGLKALLEAVLPYVPNAELRGV